MDRLVPPEYAGWQRHEPELRRMTTAQLIDEIQDGPPDRRLAALAVIDLAEVPLPVIEDWIRILPEAEVNELAGAIPVQRPNTSAEEEAKWVEVARLGYERRRVATFLVMLGSALEGLEAKDAALAAETWNIIAGWVENVYDRLALAGDLEALADIELFLFENYLDRRPLLDVFAQLVERHERLALRVSTDPAAYLANVPEEGRRRVLEAAERGGGLDFAESWSILEETV
ncbi:MAG: hypothetical protein NZ761_03945 [Dehalococcoidia bacterium]|nr:hypothetical protein [Dehalococcoidia bacterium]